MGYIGFSVLWIDTLPGFNSPGSHVATNPGGTLRKGWKMTAMMSETMDLQSAVEVAGDGGTVRRNDVAYAVRCVEGEWQIGIDDLFNPLSYYVTDNWHVVQQGPGAEATQGDWTSFLNAAKAAGQEGIVEHRLSDSSTRQYVVIRFNGDGTSARVRNSSDHWDSFWVNDRDYQSDSDTKVITVGDNGPWTEPITIGAFFDKLVPGQAERFALQLMAERSREVRVSESLADDLREVELQRDRYLSDLEMINNKINAYADESHMCGDYERRIFGWNEDMRSDFRLEGRVRNHDVAVRIPALRETEFYLQVEARSQEQADQMVKGMSVNEIVAMILERGYTLSGLLDGGVYLTTSQGGEENLAHR